MPAIFGDHMVLQQGTSLPIWGEADPGEKIIVQFVGQVVTTTANKRGEWRVNLQPVYLRSAPDILTVDGKNNRLTFSDVLVGDVWLCSGSSNMAFPLMNADHGEASIAQAYDSELRFFIVKKRSTLQPQRHLDGVWQRCTPESAAAFSAVGYFFGHDLRKVTQMPLGLIGAYDEGTPLQSWISLAALQESPSFGSYLSDYATIVRNFPEAIKTYAKRQEAYLKDLDRWKREVEVSYQEELASWKDECEQARLKLLAQPLKPDPSEPMPTAPQSPDGGNQMPTVLFNGMIAPLIPYAITGVLWYQGENNDGAFAFEYRRLFPRLIRSWRAAWGEGPFPFYFVSLAAHHRSSLKPVELLLDEEGNFNPAWPWVREGQAAALFLPETGMAVASDIGNAHDLCPVDKLDVGRRLGLLARKNVYGEGVTCSGPVYRSMQREGHKIRLFFDSVGKGLTIGASPWNGEEAIPLSCELQGFAIAGANRHWEEATARIEGESILVSSDSIDRPEAVRYNWKNNPSGNLYNKEGLPAAPFRTDVDQPQ